MNKTLLRSFVGGIILGIILAGGPFLFGFLDEIFQNILPIDIFEFVAIPLFFFDTFILLPFNFLSIDVCSSVEFVCMPNIAGIFILFVLPVVINCLIFVIKDLFRAINSK
jgi:hypothetical protein